MKTILPTLARSAALTAVLALAFFGSASLIHAAGTLTALQTVPNFTTVNDQTAVTASSTLNVAQTKATRTLNVNSVPVASTTSTIGNCIVTYSTTVADSLNCTGNAAILNITTHNATTTIGATLATLTNVSDTHNGHGALTITTASTTADIFTTTGTEASSTPITFTDGTSGAVTSTASTNGVVPVAQIDTVTTNGTVEIGDVYSVGIPTGTISYYNASSTVTQTYIANQLGAAVVASSTYSGQPFTVSTSTNTVIFTAKVAGTGFFQNSTTTNSTTTPVAQIVSFTPTGVSGPENYTVTLNGTSYTYDDTSGVVATITAGLQSVLAGNPVANCVSEATIMNCSAQIPGIAFTYSASSVAPVVYSSGGGSGGFTESIGRVNHITPTIPSITAVTTINAATGSTNGASKIKKTIKYGNENASVKILQQLLASDPSLNFNGTISGYFGLKTRAAVEAFQVKYGVVAAGGSGYGSVGPKTRAELVTVFGQ